MLEFYYKDYEVKESSSLRDIVGLIWTNFNYLAEVFLNFILFNCFAIFKEYVLFFLSHNEILTSLLCLEKIKFLIKKILELYPTNNFLNDFKYNNCNDLESNIYTIL